MTPQHHLPADIERTSISIITRELDELGPDPAAGDGCGGQTVIHTTADFDYAKNLRFTPGAVQAAVRALQRGAGDRHRHQYGAGGHFQTGPCKAGL